jgi:voltage-gated potassium channel
VRPAGRVRAGLLLLSLVLVVGTTGYMAIEDLAFTDAFFMSVITVTTVGYREVGGDLTPLGEWFTIFIIVTGVGTVLYTAAVGFEAAVEAMIGGRRLTRTMERHIARMNDHIILCGFGRVGQNVWQQLDEAGTEVVVVDADPDRVAAAIQAGAIVVEGDATHDEVLISAGLDHARTLISAVQSDSDNLVIVLSARARRPDLLIVARAVESETEKKLYLAGADRVVAPQVVGAQRLAALALKPDLAEFIDLVVSGTTVEFRVEEMHVGSDSEIVGKSLRDLDLRRRAGALVLAVGDESGRMSLNPDPSLVFHPGQVIIGIGTSEQLESLRALATVPA